MSMSTHSFNPVSLHTTSSSSPARPGGFYTDTRRALLQRSFSAKGILFVHNGSGEEDFEFRPDRVTLTAIKTLESIRINYSQIITSFEAKYGTLKTWKFMDMSALSPKQQQIVYKVCPKDSFSPTMGIIETLFSDEKKVVIFHTSGYILV